MSFCFVKNFLSVTLVMLLSLTYLFNGLELHDYDYRIVYLLQAKWE